MTLEEWATLAKAVNADIAGMAKAQRVQTDVHDAIDFRAANPMEEQFIDADAFDQPPGEQNTIRVHGVELKISKLHRVGLQARDVKGADLFYEITHQKFVLFQYKAASPAGRVNFDKDQLAELQLNCPNSCPPSNRFNCGSWFALRTTNGSS